MDNKICGKCKCEKALLEFSFKSKEKDKYQSYCKSCNKIYVLEHYKKNKTVYMARAYLYNKTNRQIIKEKFKEFCKDKSCVDCGETDPVVFQFDHVKDDKKFNIGNMLNGGYCWQSIMKEIEKCDIRCANCHQRKTAKQFNWNK